MESILTSTKLLLGLTEEDTSFDRQIIMHINSVLMRLRQLAVGSPDAFRIEDAETTWVDFLGDSEDLEAVKTYVYLKVKMVFDPPTNATLYNSFKEQIREYEWCLNIEAEQEVSVDAE